MVELVRRFQYIWPAPTPLTLYSIFKMDLKVCHTPILRIYRLGILIV